MSEPRNVKIASAMLEECFSLFPPPAQRHFLNNSLLIDNRFAITGKDNGIIQIHDILKEKKTETLEPFVDLKANKENFEKRSGCGSRYCVEGYRFSGVFNPKLNAVFLLADIVAPEFFIINLNDSTKFQKITAPEAITSITLNPEGYIVLGALRGGVLISDLPYPFSDKINFTKITTHKMNLSVDSIAFTSKDNVAISSEDLVSIYHIPTKQLKQNFYVKGNYKLVATEDKLIGSSNSGFNVWDTATWNYQEFKEKIIDFSVYQHYVGLAVLEEYKRDSKHDYSETKKSDNEVLERKISQSIHCYQLQAKTTRIKIKIFDLKTSEFICEYQYKRNLEQNILLRWAPSGKLMMVYEPYCSRLHPIYVFGLNSTPTVSNHSFAFKTPKKIELKKKPTEKKERKTLRS